MNCPHCSNTSGHYSVVEYKTIDTNVLTRQQYMFCHACAHKVYDDEPNFVQQPLS